MIISCHEHELFVMSRMCQEYHMSWASAITKFIHRDSWCVSCVINSVCLH